MDGDLANVLSQVRRTEAALETAGRELEAARAVCPRIEAQARKRVIGELRAIYLREVETFTAALEAASAAQEVLYALYPRILMQFPTVYEDIDGVDATLALGVPAPQFDDIRPAQAFSGSPMASKVYRWRLSVASASGGFGDADSDLTPAG